MSENLYEQESGFHNKSLVWTMSKLIGSEVEVLTIGNETLRGVLDTFTKNASVVLKCLRDLPKDQLQPEQETTATVIIQPEHLICLRGKFTKQSTSRFTDDAISKTIANNNNKIQDLTLIPWEDDDGGTYETKELVLEDNEASSGWDSGNMLSTFEKANPGKTSYFGMEQYTNVEVPVLCENKVREITQLLDQIQTVDDDFKEDDIRTEEQKFAAVDRPEMKSSTNSVKSIVKSRTTGSEKDRFYWSNSKQNIHSQANRKKDRFGSLHFVSKQSSNFDNTTLPMNSIAGNSSCENVLPAVTSQSQSARSSPYPRKPLQPQQSYTPRRGLARGNLRYSRNRYRGHPSLPINIHRVNSQDTSMYYYNQNARYSPIRRHDLEMYERQQQRIEKDPLHKDTSAERRMNLEEPNSNTETEHTSDVDSSSLVKTSPTDINNTIDNSFTNDLEASSDNENKAQRLNEIVHSNLNPMADVFVPSRAAGDDNTTDDTTISSEQQSSDLSHMPISEHMASHFSATPLVGPFTITPLLQALPNFSAQQIPTMSIEHHINRAPYSVATSAIPANYMASYAQQGVNRYYSDIPIDLLRPMVPLNSSTRKAIVSVNMPVVENPFIGQSTQTTDQLSGPPVLQESKSRKYILTSDETSTTIQVPSTPLINRDTRLSSSSNPDDVLDPLESNVVIESGFNSTHNYPEPKEFSQPIPSSEAQAYACNLSALNQQQAMHLSSQMIPQPGGIQYTPTYYIVNPAAFASSGIIAPQALYQSTPIFPSYQFCGYPTAPIGILPLTSSFPTPNPGSANAMFVGQEHLFDPGNIRRLRFPGSGGGRRYSESVISANRHSYDNATRESPARQNYSTDNRSDIDDYRRKPTFNPDGDNRRPYHRRRGGVVGSGSFTGQGTRQNEGSQSRQHFDSSTSDNRRRGSNNKNYAQSSNNTRGGGAGNVGSGGATRCNR